MSEKKQWTTESWLLYRITATRGEVTAAMQCYAHNADHARVRAHMWIVRQRKAFIEIEPIKEAANK
jgi:hypothetical protein